MTKFYQLITRYNSNPMMTPMVHGLSITYEFYVKTMSPEERDYEDYDMYHGKLDPHLDPMPPETNILYRTGPYVPASLMMSFGGFFLYCREQMKSKIKRDFPYISFRRLPVGRIVNLSWQDWEPGDNPDERDEPEDYIYYGVHDEKLAAEMGDFYQLHFPVGAWIKTLEILPRYWDLVPEPNDSFSCKHRSAIDSLSWNGYDFFYGGRRDSSNTSISNELIYVSENGKQWIEDNQLADFFAFEELLDLSQWQQYAKG